MKDGAGRPWSPRGLTGAEPPTATDILDSLRVLHAAVMVDGSFMAATAASFCAPADK